MFYKAFVLPFSDIHYWHAFCNNTTMRERNAILPVGMDMTNSNGTNVVLDVLLVACCEEQIRLVRTTLGEHRIPGRLHTVDAYAEALAYLLRETPYQNAPVPRVVLLGQGLAADCPCEFITDLQCDPRLRRLSVFALPEVVANGRPTANDCRHQDHFHIEVTEISRLADAMRTSAIAAMR